MGANRHSLNQIRNALEQLSAGARPIDVARPLGISERTLFRWKQRYEGRSDGEAAVAAARQNAQRRRSRREAEREQDEDALLEKLLGKE